MFFAIASLYSSSAMMARIWPALFPGRTLPLIDHIRSVLPDIEGVRPVAAGETSVFNRQVTLVVIGLDKRPGDRFLDSYRTDVVMIANLDPVSKRANLLSFPRDMLIEVNQNKFRDRINVSYGVGVRNGKSFEAGAEQLIGDIKRNFGIDVDHWMVIDFKGVEKLVNIVGGVDVEIPYELSVPSWYYSDDDVNARYVSFAPGKHHLDGYNAVAFGRYRNDSDLYRVKRQQLVVQAALAKALSSGLLDPTNIPDLWDAYNDSVRTDLGKGPKLLGYADLLRQTQGNLRAFSVGDPVNGVPSVWAAQNTEASVLEWNPENVRYWITQWAAKGAYANVKIEIQNGIGLDGDQRAAALGRYLSQYRGLAGVTVGPDASSQASSTITVYGSDRRSLAEDLAKWSGIPPANIREEPRVADSGLPDVIVTLGRDFKLPGG